MSVTFHFNFRVASPELPGLAFSRPKTNLAFLKLVGLEIFYNLLSSWPYIPEHRTLQWKNG